MAEVVGISPTSVRRSGRGKGWSRIACAVQALQRPQVRRQAQRCGRPLCRPASARRGLSVDEKSQIQALDRTQPGLPLKKGRCATMTQDYKRHGTTTLFAALDVLEGKVIGRCMQRHRQEEFIRFLNAVEREMRPREAVHVVLDNYATTSTQGDAGWSGISAGPSTSRRLGCWANAVEGVFAKLTRQRLKRGVFTRSSSFRPPSTASSPKPTTSPSLRLDRRRHLAPCAAGGNVEAIH